METIPSPGPFAAEPGEVEHAFANRYISPYEYLRARFMHSWQENLASLFYRRGKSYFGIEDEQARQEYLTKKELYKDIIASVGKGQGYQRLGLGASVLANLSDPVAYFPVFGTAGKLVRVGQKGVTQIAAAVRSQKALSKAMQSAADHILLEGSAAIFARDQLEDIGMPLGSRPWFDRITYGSAFSAASGSLSGAFLGRSGSGLTPTPRIRRQRLRPGISFSGPAGQWDSFPQQEQSALHPTGRAGTGPSPRVAAGLGFGKALWDMETGRPVSVSGAMLQGQAPQAFQASPIWDRVERRTTLYGSALHYAAHAGIR